VRATEVQQSRTHCLDAAAHCRENVESDPMVNLVDATAGIEEIGIHLAAPSDTSVVRLTTQEIECLRWCKEGKTNWEIGAILEISAKTVEFHLGNAMRKLNAANRITAVIMGLKLGIIDL
jgi:DNA-binding CsgD family transcriptional regulator